MVVRRDAAGVLAIGQPAHAALCGQFARAWGNDRFAAIDPLDDVALGAQQHDLGWARWDLTPEYDADTGLPRDFMHTALQRSVALWRTGPPQLESQSRWAALLATMHGRRLYERIDLGSRTDAEADAVRELLAELAAHERRLTAALQADPATAAAAGPVAVARTSDLVWTWDVLSLALLLDWAPHTLRAVPAAAGATVDVELRAVAARASLPALSLSPWPFADRDQVIVHTEGRRLSGPYPDERALSDAWVDAPWETVAFALVPAVAES